MNIVSDFFTSNCFGVTGFDNSSINCLNVFISYLRLNFLIILFASIFFAASGTAPLGILVVVGAPNTFF